MTIQQVMSSLGERKYVVIAPFGLTQRWDWGTPRRVRNGLLSLLHAIEKRWSLVYPGAKKILPDDPAWPRSRRPLSTAEVHEIPFLKALERSTSYRCVLIGWRWHCGTVLITPLALAGRALTKDEARKAITRDIEVAAAEPMDLAELAATASRLAKRGEEESHGR